MHKKNLRKYRNKIDELDNKIFILIKNRTQLIKHILSEKKFKNQIVDRKRINAILKKIFFFIHDSKINLLMIHFLFTKRIN